MRGDNMPTTDMSRAADRVARRLIVSALLLTAPLAVLFVGWSEIDRLVAAKFYTGGRTFLGDRLWWSEPLRNSFQVFYFGCIALTVIGLWRAWAGASWLRRPRFAWLYLGLCLLVGPALVTHGLFKIPFGRPRPMQTTEFGGSLVFKPAFVPSRQCNFGCSFVSGESASTFIPFFAGAILFPQVAPLIIAGGTVAGMAAGGVRMLQGRHFLSDVLFAGLAMALVAALTLPFARRLDAAIGRSRGRRVASEAPAADQRPPQR